MSPLRLALTLGATAVAAGALAQGAAAAAPTAITGTVSAIGGVSATLNGTVNPGGAATEWWFEYGTSTSYGSATSHTNAGSGAANVTVSRTLTGLAPATTHHYRLVAKSASGTSNGADGLFTTASPPSVFTSPATGVGPATATLGGTVNPNGQPTTWFVEYGTSTSYGTKSATADAGSGTAAKSVSVGISGLTAGKTYHFRVVASSSAGTVNGADATFVTAEAPIATTAAASSITSAGAKLNGKVDPNGRPTSYRFEYGPTISYGTTTSSASAGSGTSASSVSKTITGLKAGIVYHFRLVASSDAGSATGSDQAFTTQGPPTVATGQVTAAGPTSATLAGLVNPNGRSTTWYIDYGPTASYGARTSTSSVGSGTKSVSVTRAISNLKPGTIYHFRVVAVNSLGTTRGVDATFATTGAQSATTGPVTLTTLSLYAARVNGTVNAHGLATTWWFEYGRTRAYGFRTAALAATGNVDRRVSARLTGLAPGVRYHYRLVVQSSIATSVGADASFSTPPRPLDPSGRPVRCTIVGTQGPDLLRGTSRRDVICGLGGNDTILAGRDNDVVYGGPGADVINGGAGRDTLRGGLGNDTLQAREGGRDILVGGAGSDLALADRRLDQLNSIERRRF